MIKRYDRFIESRKHRVLPEGVYTERHHILPRCQGGNNNNENLIVLTAREHYIAHKMLYRENKECNELVYAFHMMCSMKTNHQQRDYKITSRDFELSRIALSESMRGENNPNYGKHHPEETKEKMRGPRPCIQGENNPMYGVHRCGKDAPNYGKHHSEETRKKIGESSKDRHHSEETRKNLSEANKGENNPNYGKHHSEETKKKMGDKLKGRIPWNKGKSVRRSDASIMKQINSLQGDSYICCETEVIINNVIELRKYLGNQKAQIGAIRSSVKRGGTAYGYHWDILERIS